MRVLGCGWAHLSRPTMHNMPNRCCAYVNRYIALAALITWGVLADLWSVCTARLCRHSLQDYKIGSRVLFPPCMGIGSGVAVSCLPIPGPNDWDWLPVRLLVSPAGRKEGSGFSFLSRLLGRSPLCMHGLWASLWNTVSCGPVGVKRND